MPLPSCLKLAADPFVGQLTFLRIYSGTIRSGSYVYNASKNERERVGRLVRMHANEREEVKEAYAGEIVAAVGLKSTLTSDTLCDEDHPIILEKIVIPEPVISLRIEPKTKADQEKMGLALKKLSDEDPTFRIRSDAETNEVIIAGMGELHLEIIVDRMKREFNVEANTGKPQVAYRETITGEAEEEHKYIKQTGGKDNMVTSKFRFALSIIQKSHQRTQRDTIILSLQTQSREELFHKNLFLPLRRALLKDFHVEFLLVSH